MGKNDEEYEIRDPENGRIIEKGLPAERAKEMAKARWEKDKRVKGEDVEQLLVEAGYGEENPAPTTLRMLAENIVRGGGGAVGALREFIRMTRQPEPATAENVRQSSHQVEVLGDRLAWIDGGFYRRLEEFEIVELRDELYTLRHRIWKQGQRAKAKSASEDAGQSDGGAPAGPGERGKDMPSENSQPAEGHARGDGD